MTTKIKPELRPAKFVSYSLPISLHTQLKDRAYREGTSASKLLRDAVEQLLDGATPVADSNNEVTMTITRSLENKRWYITDVRAPTGIDQGDLYFMAAQVAVKLDDLTASQHGG